MSKRSARARAASSTPLAVLVVMRVQVDGGHVGPEVVVSLAGSHRLLILALIVGVLAVPVPAAFGAALRPRDALERVRTVERGDHVVERRALVVLERRAELRRCTQHATKSILKLDNHYSHSSSHKCFAYYSYKS